MKVLLILADNVYLTPYLKFYTTILDELSYDYNILYWDKNGNEKIKDEKYIRFSTQGKSRFGKIFGYLKYRKFIIGICKKNKFDLLISLHAIVPFILYRLFVKKYNRRYIYDVRDYSYEKFCIYRWAEKGLVNASLINIISSEGYKNFLPKSEYFVVHNVPKMELNDYKQVENRETMPIQISYIGLIRFMEQNKKILQFFKNDKRFHLNFIGTNAEVLQPFCDENKIENVTLIGTFNPRDTLLYYKKTDVIMNLYGNHTPLLDYALSNKLYYAASLYKPILVCKDTHMEEVTQKYQLGFTLELLNDAEKDMLESYVKDLDRNQFIQQCELFMSMVNEEQIKAKAELIRRIEQIEG